MTNKKTQQDYFIDMLIETAEKEAQEKLETEMRKLLRELIKAITKKTKEITLTHLKEEVEKKMDKLEWEQINLHYTEMDKSSNDGEIRGLKTVLAIIEEAGR